MRRHNFKNLQIWQESINLITDIYNFTATLPEKEKFGLISQLNRSCVSIASNIAEGTSKRSNKHFIKYLEDSLGSAYEWETQIIICKNLDFISEEKFNDFENRIKKFNKKYSTLLIN